MISIWKNFLIILASLMNVIKKCMHYALNQPPPFSPSPSFTVEMGIERVNAAKKPVVSRGI